MKTKRQTEALSVSVTMLDGKGGHVTTTACRDKESLWSHLMSRDDS